MKKRIFIVACLLTAFIQGRGQLLDWQWARNGISLGSNSANSCLTSDLFDNVFIAGEYGDSLTLNHYTLTDSGINYTNYFAKYDSKGNLLWAKGNIGGAVILSKAATDKSGNVYITGSFDQTAYFGSFNLTDGDIFLVKFDSSGNVLWAKSAGGTDDDYGLGVATDASGNVYITGYYRSPSFTIGSFTFTHNSSFQGIFLAKFDSSGNALWAKSSVGGFGEGNDVSADDLGNVYLTGDISDTVSFGAYKIGGSAAGNVFLAKYDSSGNALWAKSSQGTGLDWANAVTVDAANNIYITGNFYSPVIYFGALTLTNKSGGDIYAFIVKYNSSGDALWAKKCYNGNNTNTWGVSVSAYKSDKIYMSGECTWDSLYVDTLSISIPTNSWEPMYVAGFDTGGHVFMGTALACGGGGFNSLSVGKLGDLYVGSSMSEITMILGKDTLYPSPTFFSAPFIAKLYYGPPVNFTSNETIFCNESENCINFSDLSVNNPTSWKWYFPGATPDTSTQQNPTNICYDAAGNYNVTLIASNGTANDTLTINNYISILPAPPTPVITQHHDTLYSSTDSSYSSYQWFLGDSIINGATDSILVVSHSGNYNLKVTGTDNCSVAAGINVLGIKELYEANYISLNPNPATNQLTIHTSSFHNELVMVSVLNVLGQETSPPTPLQRRGEDTVIDVSRLAAGMYFVEMKTESGSVVKRFVKE